MTGPYLQAEIDCGGWLDNEQILYRTLRGGPSGQFLLRGTLCCDGERRECHLALWDMDTGGSTRIADLSGPYDYQHPIPLYWLPD